MLHNGRILLSFAYAEVFNSDKDPLNGTEVIGCYCGSPEELGYFYWTRSVDHAPAVIEEFEELNLSESGKSSLGWKKPEVVF